MEGPFEAEEPGLSTQEMHKLGGGLESEAGLSPEPLGLTLESAHHGRPVHHLDLLVCIPLARRGGLALELQKICVSHGASAPRPPYLHP